MFFKDCDNLETLVLPDSIVNIEKGTFDNCKKLVNVECDPSFKQLFFNSIYSIAEGTEVVDEERIKHWKNLEILEVPTSVKEIKEHQFDNCINITKISVDPKHLNHFHKQTIEVLEVTEGVEEVNSKDLIGLDNLQKLIINKNIKSISGEIVKNLPRLESIKCDPEVIKSFSSEIKEHLYNIEIPEDCKKIPDFAFQGVSNIQFISLPFSVNEIGEGAFKDCTNLQATVHPPDVKVIKKDTFKGCKKLNKVYFPLSLEKIEDGAFDGCEKINEINCE